MKRLAVFISVVICVGAWAAPAAAQGTCTMQNLAGTYVFESKGSSALVSGLAPPAYPSHVMALYAPIEVIGRMTIAADGSVEGFYWAAIGTTNSGLDPVHWEGQISDFADCRGIITYAVPLTGMQGPMATIVEHFVVVDGGKELRTVMKSYVVPGNPPTQLPATWNTTARRVSKGKCGLPAVRGEWVMTCQSLHTVTPNPYAAAAEAALITVDVEADGTFTGLFDTKIATTSLLIPVTGSFSVGDACTVAGDLSPAPGVVITAKGVLFSEGKEFLVIPIQTTTPGGVIPNTYDNCRGIRRDR
jgi:hypothetical protein